MRYPKRSSVVVAFLLALTLMAWTVQDVRLRILASLKRMTVVMQGDVEVNKGVLRTLDAIDREIEGFLVGNGRDKRLVRKYFEALITSKVALETAPIDPTFSRKLINISGVKLKELSEMMADGQGDGR